jgi:hypothetical protein
VSLQIKGTALTPGVSRNGRWYTRDTIARAVARAQERLTDPKQPITMRTHHGAEDDTTRVVGKVTALEVAPDGSARFTAQLADTSAGQDLAVLVDPDDPYVTGVSIRGQWLEDPRTVPGPDGQMVETADDMEILGLDFTTQPGVIGARIGEGTRAGRGRAVRESVEQVRVTRRTTITEAQLRPMSRDVFRRRGAALLGESLPARRPPRGSLVDTFAAMAEEAEHAARPGR